MTPAEQVARLRDQIKALRMTLCYGCEACAKISETEFSGNGTHLTWREIATAIRARAQESEG